MADTAKKRRRGPKSVLTESTKKRHRQEVDAKKAQTRIYLGSQADRWRASKTKSGLTTDSDFAKLLLDRYDENIDRPGPSTSSALTSSTPLSLGLRSAGTPTKHMAVLSEISAAESGGETTMSGVEEISAAEEPSIDEGKRKRKQAMSESFVNPLDLTLEISEVEEEGDDDIYNDPDYKPEFNFSIMPEGMNDDVEELAFEEAEFGQEMEKDGEDVVTAIEVVEEDVGPGVKRVKKSPDDIDQLIKDDVCLVYVRQLLALAHTAKEQCSVCRMALTVDVEFLGSAVYLKWICADRHVEHIWCSQPILNRRLHSGDFLISATCVTSGNNFGKLALWAKMLNLHFPSAAVFHRIQNFYIAPTVDVFWREHQTELIESLAGKDIVLMGDGRMDSPGHSAQYCSYTLMEMESKKVLSLVTMDKRVVDRKSTTMEKEAFRRSIDELKAKGLHVKEVVTDAHMGIGYLMRTSYPEIKHSHDIWHIAKNLGKRITKAGQKKGCKDILRWAKHIVNHFWYACREATSYMRFINIWGQVRHHACNEHEWILSEGEGPAECSHGDLEEDANRPDWLPKESLSAKALNETVLDKRLRNSYGYFENFRMTAEIEVFNNLILMYCAKRFAYSPPAYRTRNLLAALDNNCHIDRPLLLNKRGDVVYHRTFNKKSGRWSVYPCKVAKSYQHVRELQRRMLSVRLEDKMGMHRPKAMAADDPRRLSLHLAPVSPAATKELVSEQMTRKKETGK